MGKLDNTVGVAVYRLLMAHEIGYKLTVVKKIRVAHHLELCKMRP